MTEAEYSVRKHAGLPVAPEDRWEGAPTRRLLPVWRLEPFRPENSFAVMLDPREACHVLANGASLDGVRYRASFNGWDGRTLKCGRVTVRCDPA